MQVDGFLRESAARTPDAVALIEPSRSIRYAELDALTDRFANLFIANGVSRGDRVIIAGENSVEFVAAYFGCQRAGGTAVPMPAGARNPRFVKAIDDCQPKVAIVDPATAADPVCRKALQAVARVFVFDGAIGRPWPALAPFVSLGQSLQAAVAQPAARAIDQDLAAIIYTSGSTGEPLGVMLTHRNIVANTRSIVEYLSLGPQDRVISVLPFYYVYGLSLLHTHVAVGGSVVIDNRFAYPAVVLQAMRDHEVTGLAGVPATFMLLLNRPDFTAASLPAALRYVTQAGGGMPPVKIVEWRERVPGVPFVVMYGATEASARLTYLDPAALPGKLGSIGRPIPNVEMRVLKEDGSVAVPGEVGELVARGANIALGYWNRPDETRLRFTAEGYRTGDLGYVDEDGYLFLVGRRHDMIKIGAHRVGPKEIEDVIIRHPSVADVAVVGAPSEMLGEVAVAFVSVSEPSTIDAEALRRFCQQHLAAYKVPSRFVFIDDLPRIPSVGKIDKVRLRSMLASEPVSSGAPSTSGDSRS